MRNWLVLAGLIASVMFSAICLMPPGLSSTLVGSSLAGGVDTGPPTVGPGPSPPWVMSDGTDWAQIFYGLNPTPGSDPKRDPLDPSRMIYGYVVQKVTYSADVGYNCDTVTVPQGPDLVDICVPGQTEHSDNVLYEMFAVEGPFSDEFRLFAEGCCLTATQMGEQVYIDNDAMGTPEWDALTDPSFWGSQGEQNGKAPVDLPGPGDYVDVGGGLWSKDPPPGWPTFGGHGSPVVTKQVTLDWLVCSPNNRSAWLEAE